jgi:hypothetical protein
MARLKLAHPAWGPRKIANSIFARGGQAASKSGFKRVLERSGLTQVGRRGKASEAGRLCNGKKAQVANEIWTEDFKGWWWMGRSRREPLTVRDEYSRYLLELRALENARTQTVQRSF